MLNTSKATKEESGQTKQRQRNNKKQIQKEVTLLLATKQLKLVDSNLFLGSSLEAKKLYRILQSSLSYIDSIKEFQATIFKGPSVFIPREIE